MAIKRAIKAGNKSIISFKKAIKVGEITQWFDKDKFSPSATNQTLTFTNNGDGSITVSGIGVNTAQAIYGISNLKELIKGHKYLLSGCPKSTDNHFLSLNVYNNDGKLLAMYLDGGSGSIFTFDQEYYSRDVGGVYIYEREVGAEINRTYTPQLFDLTEMFGAGHEPATVAEFKAKFPEAYYPYQRAVLTVYNKVVRPCARKGEVVQLLDKNTYYQTQTVSGITATNNGDGSWTINGTATKTGYINFSPALTSIIGGHKILICGNKENSNFKMGLLNQPIRDDTGTGAIGIFNQSAAKTWGIEWANGAVINNVTIYPQLFDLTAMYGAGNEPKTLADFRKDFPESYYPYSPIQTKNLWTCNKTSSSYFKYDKATQIYTITRFGSESCYKLPSAIPAGETFTISVKCLSGEIQNDCVVTLGGYHNVSGDATSWEVLVELPRGEDVTGRTFTATMVTTHTLTDFWIFVNYPVIPKNLRFMVQLEKGSVATDYVPHDYI